MDLCEIDQNGKILNLKSRVLVCISLFFINFLLVNVFLTKQIILHRHFFFLCYFSSLNVFLTKKINRRKGRNNDNEKKGRKLHHKICE